MMALAMNCMTLWSMVAFDKHPRRFPANFLKVLTYLHVRAYGSCSAHGRPRYYQSPMTSSSAVPLTATSALRAALRRAPPPFVSPARASIPRSPRPPTLRDRAPEAPAPHYSLPQLPHHSLARRGRKPSSSSACARSPRRRRASTRSATALLPRRRRLRRALRCRDCTQRGLKPLATGARRRRPSHGALTASAPMAASADTRAAAPRRAVGRARCPPSCQHHIAASCPNEQPKSRALTRNPAATAITRACACAGCQRRPQMAACAARTA